MSRKHHPRLGGLVMAGLLATGLMLGGCGGGDDYGEGVDGISWIYTITADVPRDGHTTMDTDGFMIIFEGYQRSSSSRGQLLVVGPEAFAKKSVGKGGNTFTHHYDGDQLNMTMFGLEFAVVNKGKQLEIGGKTFDIGEGASKATIIVSGGSARLGSVRDVGSAAPAATPGGDKKPAGGDKKPAKPSGDGALPPL